MSETYVADARFEDGQWQATVRGLRGAHTYARTVETLRKRLREVVVLMDDRQDDDLHDEDAFQVALAFDVRVTDDVGATDSVSVTVRTGTPESQAQVHEPRVTVTGSKAVEVDAARSVKPTPSVSIEVGAKAKKVKAPPTGSVEMVTKAVLVAGKPSAAGAIHPKATSSLGGAGTLAAGAAPHEAVAYGALVRQRADEAEREAEHATRMAVLIGLSGGMGMRDIAALLGISHQRVSQIAGAEGDAVRRRRARA